MLFQREVQLYPMEIILQPLYLILASHVILFFMYYLVQKVYLLKCLEEILNKNIELYFTRFGMVFSIVKVKNVHVCENQYFNSLNEVQEEQV